jgi:large subunit ribosomal protein L1
MNKNEILNALEIVKKNSPKRNFKQSYDLIITLKNIDLKKTDNHIDIFTSLHYDRGKKVKICALVGPELKLTAQKFCDTTIMVDDFDKYAKDKKLTKRLAQDHEFFIAQANIMPKVAAAFGKVLGPKGRMPNPKAGCVVPPNANLEPLVKKLEKTVRIKINTGLLFQARIGNEDTPNEHLIDNAMMLYNNLAHALPNEQNNLKNIFLKFTMGPPVKIGAKKETKEDIKEIPKSLKKGKIKEETVEEKTPLKETKENKKVKKIKKD